MTPVMQKKIGAQAHFVTVDLKGDGYEVKQRFHKEYTDTDGNVNEAVLCIAHTIHFEKAAIESKFGRVRSELKQDTSPELEAEINLHDNIHFEWTKRLARLNELLGLLENGRFLLQCTLVSCPNHSVNKGKCHHEKDLTLILRYFPEYEGCAEGRTLLGVDARRYGEVLPLDTEVTVIKPRPKKR